VGNHTSVSAKAIGALTKLDKGLEQQDEIKRKQCHGNTRQVRIKRTKKTNTVTFATASPSEGLAKLRYRLA